MSQTKERREKFRQDKARATKTSSLEISTMGQILLHNKDHSSGLVRHLDDHFESTVDKQLEYLSNCIAKENGEKQKLIDTKNSSELLPISSSNSTSTATASIEETTPSIIELENQTKIAKITLLNTFLNRIMKKLDLTHKREMLLRVD